MRFLEHAGPLVHCTGERAACVAKELGFDEVVRQRRAVQRAERAVPARPGPVQRPRHQFFATAALTLDKHSEGRGRGPLDTAAKLDDGFAHADDVASPRRGRTGPPRHKG